MALAGICEIRAFQKGWGEPQRTLTAARSTTGFGEDDSPRDQARPSQFPSVTDTGTRLLPSPFAGLLVLPLPKRTLKKQNPNFTVRIFPRNSEITENTQRLFFMFWLLLAACGILAPRPGINPTPLQWKHGVLTTGPPGKSPQRF